MIEVGVPAASLPCADVHLGVACGECDRPLGIGDLGRNDGSPEVGMEKDAGCVDDRAGAGSREIGQGHASRGPGICV